MINGIAMSENKDVCLLSQDFLSEEFPFLQGYFLVEIEVIHSIILTSKVNYNLYLLFETFFSFFFCLLIFP